VGASRCHAGERGPVAPVTIARTVAGIVAAAQLAAGVPDAVAAAYARAAESVPMAAFEAHPRGRRDLLAWQISSSELSSTERAVFNALLLHDNHERQDAWPSYQTIADRAGCSRRTAIRAMHQLERLGFVSVERRFRVVDRWPGRERHRRTNVYRFADGRATTVVADDEPSAPPPTAAAPQDESQPSQSAPTASTPSAPPKAAPIQVKPRATEHPYWDTFVAAFNAEHERVYGAASHPGTVRDDDLLGRTGGLLLELVSECDAWARQRGLSVERTEIASSLSHRMAATWLTWSGTDNRLRERRHPLGWICGDLPSLAYGRAGEFGAVERWKRDQKATPATAAKPVEVRAPVEESAIVRAEARALHALLARHVSLDEALRMARAEADRHRASLAGAGPPAA